MHSIQSKVVKFPGIFPLPITSSGSDSRSHLRGTDPASRQHTLIHTLDSDLFKLMIMVCDCAKLFGCFKIYRPILKLTVAFGGYISDLLCMYLVTVDRNGTTKEGWKKSGPETPSHAQLIGANNIVLVRVGILIAL
jgi:hypothetical protein